MRRAVWELLIYWIRGRDDVKLLVSAQCRLSLLGIIKHVLVLTDNNDAQLFLSYALQIKSKIEKQIKTNTTMEMKCGQSRDMYFE